MSDATRYALQRAVRAERSRAGLSQAQLAERLGWARTTLAAVESGERRVNADELPELCKALGVTLAVLLQMAPDVERINLGI
jgi:transcriptional regulator with XRE-family HTH domain